MSTPFKLPNILILVKPITFWGRSLISKIRSYLKINKEICIMHVYREVNLYADALAKQGIHHFGGIYLFDSCPTSIVDLYEGDLVGTIVAKFVHV